MLRGNPEVRPKEYRQHTDCGVTGKHESKPAEYGHHSVGKKMVIHGEPTATKSHFPSISSKKSNAQLHCYKLTEEFLQGVKNGKYKINIAPSDLVDFGGQRSFDMTHQLFVRQNGTFVIMFDGRYAFDDPLPNYYAMTNKGKLFRCFRGMLIRTKDFIQSFYSPSTQQIIF